MVAVEIRIPQLGEGLQEARIVRFLKQPGESVQRDEPIFEMETDKAVMEIESPAEGVLGAWSACEDQVLPIGAVIGRIDTDGRGLPQEDSVQAALTESYAADRATAVAPSPDVAEPPASSDASVPADGKMRNSQVAPRTRAYAREKGLSDEELAQLSKGASGRLLPEAIDRYLADRSSTPKSSDRGFQDVELAQRQRTLVYRLQRATQEIIPATMEMPVQWAAVEEVRARLKKSRGIESEASQFLLFAWCVSQASREFPHFRSSLISGEKLRVYDHLNLGIAVARPGDELVMARIDAADSLPFQQFIESAQSGIRKARDGQDQTTETMQLSLTNMAAAGVRIGIPIIAAPAVATLFIGEVFDSAHPLSGGGIGFRREANMVLSFDHRVINGIGAANFLGAIRERVQNLTQEFPAA